MNSNNDEQTLTTINIRPPPPKKKGETKKRLHQPFCPASCLLVVDGVKTLEDHDLVGLDELRRVLRARSFSSPRRTACEAALFLVAVDPPAKSLTFWGV